MSLFDKMRTQKVLSFTLILFTLSVGIVLGTLVNQGVKAAKDDAKVAAPGASPLRSPLARAARRPRGRARSRPARPLS